MKPLEKIPCPKGKRISCIFGRRYYRLWKEWSWYCERYDFTITCQPGIYDGATFAKDTKPKHGNPPAWLVHDQVCNHPFADDNTPINADMAAQILADLLNENGHGIRAVTWKHMTRLFGCKKARAN